MANLWPTCPPCLVAPQARPSWATLERVLLVPGLQPFIKKDVCSCAGGGGLLKVHPSSASQALPEEEVSRFPFMGHPEVWALRVSWGPKTGVEGTAVPAHHQARPLRTVRCQRGQIGALLAASRPGTRDSASARGHGPLRPCLRKGQLPGARGEKSERESGQEVLSTPLSGR